MKIKILDSYYVDFQKQSVKEVFDMLLEDAYPLK